MSFIPKDPAANETIGSFTININDFPVNGIIKYFAADDVDPAGIRVEIPTSNDLKAAVASVLGGDISNITVLATGAGEMCYLDFTSDYEPPR